MAKKLFMEIQVVPAKHAFQKLTHLAFQFLIVKKIVDQKTAGCFDKRIGDVITGTGKSISVKWSENIVIPLFNLQDAVIRSTLATIYNDVIMIG